MQSMDLMILKAIDDLSDEEDYNIYDAKDIAEYLHLDVVIVEEAIVSLYDRGFLGECLSLADDGIETFYLTGKALSVIN